MLGMALQYNSFVINTFTQVSGGTNSSIKNYIDILIDAIDSSDNVYVYRSLNHLFEKTPLISWCEENKQEEFDKIIINFPNYNRQNELRSSDDSKIMMINLNKSRNNFKKLFKVSIRDFKKELASNLCYDILIDDPLYDQYDYLFEKDGKVILWTDIHELLLFIAK